ncbi:hypothetical protein [Actinoplanes sp. NPDC051859]|uniref:hypothetical protein n=1 Tax=Actinoplanes sp. NPDC051859 TaxID=3363909 RepID=UPI0037AAE205
MSSGSGSDPHMLALLRAMRLRAAAPDAAAAGAADAEAALQGRYRAEQDNPDHEDLHPEELLHPDWPTAQLPAEPSGELPAAHPFRDFSVPGVPQPEEVEHQQTGQERGGFRASIGPVPSGSRWNSTPRGSVPPTTPTPATGNTPGSDGTTPGDSTPGGTTPSGTTPGGTTPGGTTPGVILPEVGSLDPLLSDLINPDTLDSAVSNTPRSAGPGLVRPGVTPPETARPGANPSGTVPSGMMPGAARPAPGATPPLVHPATIMPPAVQQGGMRPPTADVDPGHLMDLLPKNLGLATPLTSRSYPPTPPGAALPATPGGSPHVPVPGAAPHVPVPGAAPRPPGAALPPVPGASPRPPGAALPPVPGAPPHPPGAPPPAPGSAVSPIPGGLPLPVPTPPQASRGVPLPALPPIPGLPAPAPGAQPPAMPPASGTPVAAPGTAPAAPPRRPTIPYPPGAGPWATPFPGGSTDPIGAIPAIGGPRVTGPTWQGDQFPQVGPVGQAPPVRPPVAAHPSAPVDGMNPADDAELHTAQRLLLSSLTQAGGTAEVAARLRAALVQAEPTLFARLPGSPAVQIEQLAEGLTWLVQRTDQPPALVAGFGRLGAALAECGVVPQQLQLAGAALAEAMRAGMAANGWRQDFDQAWRTTWQHAYEWIAHGMAAAQYQPTTWTAVVVSHERRRDDLAVLRLRPYLPMPYLPGQYARIEVPELPGLWRPYSLAGVPRRDNIVELHVRAKSLDGVSGALVHRIEAGAKVKIARAEGRMILPASGPDLLMIAGDTGVAPLKALLTDLAETNDPRSAVLFWGVRTLDELYDIADLTAVARIARRATIVPVISEGPSGPYAAGLVTDAVAAYGEWSSHEVYLAGPPLMLAATALALHELGVAPERIHHDQPG